MSEYENVKPRFEYRTFANQLDDVMVKKIRLENPCEGFRESQEIYIMSRANDLNNTKLRDSKMDIKCFVKNQDGFEQWNPHAKFSFPLSAKRIKEELFPAFSVECPALARETYTQDQFVTEVVDTHPQLSGARVLKRRFGTTIKNCIAEYAEVYINGALFYSVSIESTEMNDLKAAMDYLGLGRYENINYLRAIKRLTGMHPVKY